MHNGAPVELIGFKRKKQTTSDMRAVIYISGIAGGMLLIIRITGIFQEFPHNDLILVFALILLGLIFLPLVLIDRIHQNRKVDRIIEFHKGKKDNAPLMSEKKTGRKGWSMNDSPFRERKSGLSWGRGNIKAADEERKSRRSFLKNLRTIGIFAATLPAMKCQSLCANEPSGKPDEPESPNIIIIFTDDQGYADLGCYGSETNKTPRMDQLAREGTRFTDFYAQPVSGPSRSALLTGRYPIRSKGWSMPASEITFAELIREVGYQTACIGKWDVSNRKAIIERMPNAQGFDYYFGTLGANDNGTVAFHENNEPAGGTDDMGSLLRLYTDKAIDYLKNRRDREKPFLLYLAHTMMHTIIDASPAFRGTSEGGLYGDVVEEFDYETGRLLDTVDELGLRENTLIIYTTDNGPWNQPVYTENKKGHPEGSIFWGDSGSLRNGKGSCYEGGSRVPCIVRWPGKVPGNRVSDAIFATADFLPTFATLSGFDVPDDRVIDGVDQTGLLLGMTREGSRSTYFYQGNGVRKGKWKYLRAKHDVSGFAVDKEREEVEELYNLKTDIGETTNLAGQYPEKVAELEKLMQAIAEGKK